MKSRNQRYPNKKRKTAERGNTVETAVVSCTRIQEEKHRHENVLNPHIKRGRHKMQLRSTEDEPFPRRNGS